MYTWKGAICTVTSPFPDPLNSLSPPSEKCFKVVFWNVTETKLGFISLVKQRVPGCSGCCTEINNNT